MTAVYLFGGVLAILLVAVITAPLLEEKWRSVAPSSSDTDPRVRQEAALEALRELEFEFQTGKISEAEYAPLRRTYATAALDARDQADEAKETDCPRCGRPVGEQEQYCTGCGEPLANA